MSITPTTRTFNPQFFAVPEGRRWIQDAQLWYQTVNKRHRGGNLQRRKLNGSDKFTWSDFDRLAHIVQLRDESVSIADTPELMGIAEHLFHCVCEHEHEELLRRYERLEDAALRNRAKRFAASTDQSINQTHLNNVISQLYREGEKTHYRRHELNITYSTTSLRRLPSAIAKQAPLLLTNPQHLVVVTDALASLDPYVQYTVQDYLAIWGYASMQAVDMVAGAQLMLTMAARDNELERLMHVFAAFLPRHFNDTIVPLLDQRFTDSPIQNFIPARIAAHIQSFLWPDVIAKQRSELSDISSRMMNAVPRAWQALWHDALAALMTSLKKVTDENTLWDIADRAARFSQSLQLQQEIIIRQHESWLTKHMGNRFTTHIIGVLRRELAQRAARAMQLLDQVYQEAFGRLGLHDDWSDDNW